MPVPIILFVYNRPDHTRKTVEALARNELAQESELWVFSDGPKNSAASEMVGEVREYIHSLPDSGLFAKVDIIESQRNKGLAESIITGVTKVINAFGCAIVLEDDLVTAPDFLKFMNACLDYYKDDKKVGSISGYSPTKVIPDDYHHSVYLLSRSCSLGWATWIDRWQQVDWDVTDFDQFKKDTNARKRFDECGSDRFDRLRRQLELGANSWSIRFGYWQFRCGMNTVYPVVTRLRNIGNDGSGVHDGTGATYNDDLPEQPVLFELTTPEPDQHIIREVKKIYSGSRLSQFSRFLRNKGFKFVDSALRSLLQLCRIK